MNTTYGFGDPTTINFIESCCKKLDISGAVRHGAECFNFLFPQEVDKEGLLIAWDGFALEGTGKLGWKVVGEEELIQFLLARIEDGFVFPLNPKWVLCDKGWYEVWAALHKKQNGARTNNEYINLDAWFPSHIYDKVEAVRTAHPAGFLTEHELNKDRQESIIAKFELEQRLAAVRRRVKFKLKLMLMFRDKTTAKTLCPNPTPNPNNMDEQYFKGREHEMGQGIPVNLTRAINCYMEAADLGHPQAQFKVATMYEKGHGVAKDHDHAMEWFMKASTGGYAPAKYSLMLMNEPKQVKADPEKLRRSTSTPPLRSVSKSKNRGTSVKRAKGSKSSKLKTSSPKLKSKHKRPLRTQSASSAPQKKAAKRHSGFGVSCRSSPPLQKNKSAIRKKRTHSKSVETPSTTSKAITTLQRSSR